MTWLNPSTGNLESFGPLGPRRDRFGTWGGVGAPRDDFRTLAPVALGAFVGYAAAGLLYPRAMGLAAVLGGVIGLARRQPMAGA